MRRTLQIALLALAVAGLAPILHADEHGREEPTAESQQTEGARDEEIIEVSFPGQYRINAYSVDDGVGEQQTASRLRIRQGLDLDFGAGLRTHLELQLNHTSSNSSLSEESVRVRHALVEYRSEAVGRYSAGIVPLSDRFRDALFSGDWDYNLLSIVAEPPTGKISDFRFFAGVLEEGLEDRAEDDIVHYQAEYGLEVGGGSELTLAGTLIQAPDTTDESRDYYSVGLSSRTLVQATSIDAFVVFAESEQELLGLGRDGSGWASLVAVEGESGRFRWGALGSWAEGREDGGGFAPPMSLIGFNGYWGYTGIITIQGPTDTGFDADAINLSNNGYGLHSLQARGLYHFGDRFDLAIAAGWYGGSQAPGRSSRVGLDLLLMGSFRVHRVFNVDLGVAAADLRDSVSGYALGAAGGFNQPAGAERTKVALFTRLQAEF